MIYLLVKALHILAVVLWVGSLFLLSFIMATSATPSTSAKFSKFSKSAMSAEQLRSATRLTEASIGVTWLAGIALVLLGGWYTSTWWQLKVVLVVLISAIHSILHRRWRQSNTENFTINRAIPIVIAILTFMAILLVVLKRPV